MLYTDCLGAFERRYSVCGDDYGSRETSSTVPEVGGHVRHPLYMIGISSCSVFETGNWLHQQPVNIHRLSEIDRDKIFNRFAPTDHTFLPKVIGQQGVTGAAVICAMVRMSASCKKTPVPIGCNTSTVVGG